MDWTSYLFRFDARINRALLWQALLIVTMLAAVLGVVGQMIHRLSTKGKLIFSINLDFDFGFNGLFKLVDPRAYHLLASLDRTDLILKAAGLALFSWIFLATAIKRLHDRNRSGWWIVAFFIVPSIYQQFSDLLPAPDWEHLYGLPADGLRLWGIVEMFVLRGTLGDNRFGLDPLAEIENSSATPPAKNWDQSRELEIVPPSASPPGGMHVKRGA
ncbi:DUF805 domain-containing protein [Bradyrhizobium sp. CB1717]|uniref:DUF805 domain-containing protein n=1 Tax=Bradyrhizobium sp. CB1717 TaxID=3039154 RepID=UPI0024B0D7D0|nr:DUF805 domain-containing protein [Bradyrhizobium sp. CB1717]WFU24318.1 DUF805 domain-containing protein [Bradyrhizobium sp. CB1717]